MKNLKITLKEDAALEVDVAISADFRVSPRSSSSPLRPTWLELEPGAGSLPPLRRRAGTPHSGGAPPAGGAPSPGRRCTRRLRTSCHPHGCSRGHSGAFLAGGGGPAGRGDLLSEHLARRGGRYACARQPGAQQRALPPPTSAWLRLRPRRFCVLRQSTRASWGSIWLTRRGTPWPPLCPEGVTGWQSAFGGSQRWRQRFWRTGLRRNGTLPPPDGVLSLMASAPGDHILLAASDAEVPWAHSVAPSLPSTPSWNGRILMALRPCLWRRRNCPNGILTIALAWSGGAVAGAPADSNGGCVDKTARRGWRHCCGSPPLGRAAGMLQPTTGPRGCAADGRWPSACALTVEASMLPALVEVGDMDPQEDYLTAFPSTATTVSPGDLDDGFAGAPQRGPWAGYLAARWPLLETDGELMAAAEPWPALARGCS